MAEPYREGALRPDGDASGMLLRQHEFPDEYGDQDRLEVADLDRLAERAPDRVRGYIENYAGSAEIESWLREAAPGRVIACLRELLGVGAMTEWTGFRILGSVTTRGDPILTLQLFAKHPGSSTEVYSSEDAPNVLPGPRNAAVEASAPPAEPDTTTLASAARERYAGWLRGARAVLRYVALAIGVLSIATVFDAWAGNASGHANGIVGLPIAWHAVARYLAARYGESVRGFTVLIGLGCTLYAPVIAISLITRRGRTQ
ncbi:hypothetical protein KGO04_03340 [Patescibacteria group bacterium]|nr:hypothetical protein [Patescibacteria group bacterium]MDE1944345.1 hypothetical protein [Patescibacteria group bacterium]MDE1945339.1 hypothetical protein [Patescibacteria group bacterium]